MASYGFFGDVLKLSEHLRILGPSRYDVAGAGALWNLRPHQLKISYIPVKSLDNNNNNDITSSCNDNHINNHIILSSSDSSQLCKVTCY